MLLTKTVGDSIDYYKFFMKLKNRGPDKSIFMELSDNLRIGFHRLSIMDVSSLGDQPFVVEYKNRTIYTMCNGEIYNYSKLKVGLDLKSGSDCEIIPHLYIKHGISETVRMLSGEFAFIIVDHDRKTNTYTYHIARDMFGIRPLYMAYTTHTAGGGGYCISSLLKGIPSGMLEFVQHVEPRTYITISDGKFKTHTYASIKISENLIGYDYNDVKTGVRNLLIKSVSDRLISDRPLGCLLSGGLDSSLIASIASKILRDRGQVLSTFSIGMEGSTDEKYAKQVAQHIKSNHTHFKIPAEEWLLAIPEVIECIETYDITTVRASVGQYLICKHIRKNTDIKVLLIGDGSDELTSGYIYFHKAPTSLKMHSENIELLENIHYYDVLRADRGVAGNGLEARVPFLDSEFVNYYLSISPDLRMPKNNLEKWLLRSSFDDVDYCYLPDDVLFRKKEAFSDGVSSVGKSWYSIIQDFVRDFESHDKWEHNPPHTKEALYYRNLFNELFGNVAKNVDNIVPAFWLPKWCGDIKEPSARVLAHY